MHALGIPGEERAQEEVFEVAIDNCLKLMPYTKPHIQEAQREPSRIYERTSLKLKESHRHFLSS